MIYHPSYIEVRALRALGDRYATDLAALDAALVTLGDTADAALLDGLYTAKRRLYKAAVKVARAQRLPL